LPEATQEIVACEIPQSVESERGQEADVDPLRVDELFEQG
jgi:hypothetical protein